MGEPPQLVRRLRAGVAGPDAARAAFSAASRAACAATIAARLSSAFPTGCLLAFVESTTVRAALLRKGMIAHDAHGGTGQALDRAQRAALLRITERQCDARRSGARRAADPVDVALRLGRELVVDHVRHAVDVDPARRDVGRDQHADAAPLE